MTLRVAHINGKAIKENADAEFNKWSDDLLAEHREEMRKRAAKKFGIKYEAKIKSRENSA